jgi:uncharacterized membrane protein YtjA (UPF0391 family)
LEHYIPRHCHCRAILGFGGIAGTAIEIAKIIFSFFLVLFIISLLSGGDRRFNMPIASFTVD